MERQTSRVSAIKEQFETLSAKGIDVAKEAKKVKALFKKYDTDGSGDIDAKEFQILAFDLGLVLTDDEAKTFVKELDTDGNGTVDFAEFLTWWNNPEKKVAGVENENKLKALKMRLRSQSALAAASAITTSLLKTAEAAKAVEKEDRSTISLKVNIGTFDQPRSSLALTYTRSEDQATALRAATKADAEAMTVTVKLAVKEGADLFEVGEVSSGVKGVLALAKKSLKYSNVASKMDKAGDGRDVLALSFAFQPSEIDIITSGAQVLDTLKITNLEVKLDSSERPGDASNPNGASGRFSATAGLDRASIQALYDAFGASELPKNLRQGFALASALRNVSLLIESETINHFLSKEFNKVYPAEDVNGFAALKSKIIMPNLAKIFGNDELPAVFVDLYSGLVKVFSDVQGIQVALGSHVFDLSLVGLNLFENYLPTRDEIKKWIEEQEAERLRKEKEEEAANSSDDDLEAYCNFVLDL